MIRKVFVERCPVPRLTVLIRLAPGNPGEPGIPRKQVPKVLDFVEDLGSEGIFWRHEGFNAFISYLFGYLLRFRVLMPQYT